jgi:hypothetical protein
MTAQTPENYKVLTGQAHYVNFITPESFKGGDEVYKGKILIKEDEAQELLIHLDDMLDTHVASVKQANPKKRLAPHQMYSFLEKFEGYVAITFKQKYNVPTKDGGVWHPEIPIYDRKAQPDTAIKVIPNGSTVKIAWTPRPWGPQGNGGVGITMQPTGLQIIDLTTQLSAGGGNPFGEEEGTYEANQKQSVEESKDLFSDATTSDDGEDGDF